jgi:hypothetical protein
MKSLLPTAPTWHPLASPPTLFPSRHPAELPVLLDDGSPLPLNELGDLMGGQHGEEGHQAMLAVLTGSRKSCRK